jgi:integrase
VTARRGGTRGRGNAERDELLVAVLFDGALRVSEVLRIRPMDLAEADGGARVRILGKGKKRAEVSLSRSLRDRLKGYAYDKGLKTDEQFFPISRFRAHQIISRAFREAGVVKPDGVGTVHVLRHSGAIERLRETRDPRALQEQLRHTSPTMTLRYLRTLSAAEAMRVQDGVDFGW